MNLWDNIPPKRLQEFFWAFPWGKSSTIAIQYPKIQKQFGFRSFPGQWNSFQTWSKIPSTKGRQQLKPLHQPRPSWLEHLCQLRNRRTAEIWNYFVKLQHVQGVPPICWQLRSKFWKLKNHMSKSKPCFEIFGKLLDGTLKLGKIKLKVFLNWISKKVSNSKKKSSLDICDFSIFKI